MLADNEIGPVYKIPRLSPRASVAKSRWFLQVQLINSNEDTIICVLNTTNLYLVGYRTGNKFYYFRDTADGVDTLFPNLPHYVLPFLSSYGGLAQEAGDRGKIALGIAPLEQAINDLQEYRRRDLARACTVAIQMFPEAIRYRYVCVLVRLQIWNLSLKCTLIIFIRHHSELLRILFSVKAS